MKGTKQRLVLRSIPVAQMRREGCSVRTKSLLMQRSFNINDYLLAILAVMGFNGVTSEHFKRIVTQTNPLSAA